MLIGKVLNSNATLNDYTVIGSLGFIPGDAPTLVFQLVQPWQTEGLRYMTAVGATMSVALPNKDGTITTVAATAMTGDSSIWSAFLTAAITGVICGGNFGFTLTEGSAVTAGYVEGGLSLVITGRISTYGIYC